MVGSNPNPNESAIICVLRLGCLPGSKVRSESRLIYKSNVGTIVCSKSDLAGESVFFRQEETNLKKEKPSEYAQISVVNWCQITKLSNYSPPFHGQVVSDSGQ